LNNEWWLFMSKKTSLFFLFVLFFSSACQLTNPNNTWNFPTPTVTPAFTPTPVPAPLGELSYSDRPDDYPGFYQIHVLYVVPKDFTDTTRYFDGSIDESVRLMNEWFASQKDGQFFILDTYQGKLDITYVRLPVSEGKIFEYTKEKYGDYGEDPDDLSGLGKAMVDFISSLDVIPPYQIQKIYIAYFEVSESFVCGETVSFITVVYPDATNLRDQVDCKIFSGQLLDGQRGVWENILAHEVIHVLGFPVKACTPRNVDNDMHIYDPDTPDDIMGSGMWNDNPVLDPKGFGA